MRKSVLFLFIPIWVSAHSSHNFTNQVGVQVLSQLKRGPHLQSILGSQTSLSLLTAEKITEQNVNDISTSGILKDRITSHGFKINLELHANIKNGHVETTIEKDELNKYLMDWRTHFGDFGSFYDLQPESQKLVFVEGSEIQATWTFQTELEYVFYLNVPLEKDGIQLEEKQEYINEMREFVNQIKNDKRAQIILAGNKSGRPINLSESIQDDSDKLVAAHPMNRVFWDKDKKEFYYEFLGDLEDLKQLPEVKKVLRYRPAKKFLKSDLDHARIRGSGSMASGYQFVLIRGQSGNLNLRMENGKIKTE